VIIPPDFTKEFKADLHLLTILLSTLQSFILPYSLIFKLNKVKEAANPGEGGRNSLTVLCRSVKARSNLRLVPTTRLALLCLLVGVNRTPNGKKVEQ
jgi:hypothetical protein